MSAAVSLLQFGDYVMPYGTKLDAQQIDSTIEAAPMLGLNGEFAPPGLSLGAVLTLTVDMGGGGDVSPSTSSPLITLDDLNTEANAMFKRLQSSYQQLLAGYTPARYIMAQKRKASAKYQEGSFRTHAAYAIELFAQDPRWLSSALHSSTFTPNQQQSITNAGTARSYPVFTLTNNTAQPQVEISIPGNAGAYIKIVLSYTPVASDTIVIDCDPRNRANAILLNGSPRLDLLGTTGIVSTLGTDDMFPFLDPGASNVWFGIGNAIQGTLQWRDAWWV